MTQPPTPEAARVAAEASRRYQFLLGFLIERGVLTDKRYRNGTWSLQGIYGVDDSGLRGAGRTPEEALDNAIVAVNLDPEAARKFWSDTHAALASQSRPAADEASEWTLIAPDGRRFSGESPVRCAKAELDTRVPPDVQIARIWATVDEDDMSTPAPQIDASAGCVDSSGWRPIDSAPKVVGRIIGAVDGRARFICWGKASHVPVYGWILTDQGPEECDLCQPTHWQPLPNPPAESTDGLAKGDVS